MGHFTIVAFLAVCFVGVSKCIPVERQVDPTAVPFTSTTVVSSSTGYQGIKRETNDKDDDSSESQRSHKSSEEDKDRSARDAVPHGFSTTSATQMTPTMSTGMFKQELPSHESSGVYYSDLIPPRVEAGSSQSKPPGSVTTTTSATAKSS